jgi:response regulator RpfG family c-di-GMP phosphodiesterase
MFAGSDRPILQAAAIIARDHHERYEGGGYPGGQTGEKIHLYGRIAAIADVYDALGAERVYKSAWPQEAIYDYFKDQRGRQFDPQLTDLFLEHFDRFRTINETYADQGAC